MSQNSPASLLPTAMKRKRTGWSRKRQEGITSYLNSNPVWLAQNAPLTPLGPGPRFSVVRKEPCNGAAWECDCEDPKWDDDDERWDSGDGDVGNNEEESDQENDASAKSAGAGQALDHHALWTIFRTVRESPSMLGPTQISPISAADQLPYNNTTASSSVPAKGGSKKRKATEDLIEDGADAKKAKTIQVVHAEAVS